MGFRAGREAARGAGRRDCFQAQEAGLQIKAGIAGAEWGCPGQTRETTHPPPLKPFSWSRLAPLTFGPYTESKMMTGISRVPA